MVRIQGDPPQRGFMVISFVLVLSIVMLGTLRSLATFASEQAFWEREIEGRKHADEIALDCAYMLARSLAVQATIGAFEDRTVPVMDGQCSVSGIAEHDVSEMVPADASSTVESRIVGTNSSCMIRAEYGSYRSKINVEMQSRRGAMDFIKI